MTRWSHFQPLTGRLAAICNLWVVMAWIFCRSFRNARTRFGRRQCQSDLVHQTQRKNNFALHLDALQETNNSSFCLMARRAHCSGRCFAHSLTRGSTQVKSCKVLVHYIMILHAFLTGFLHVFYPRKSQHWIFADLNMFCPIWTVIPSLLLGSLYLHAFNASNRTSHNNFFDSDCLGLGSLAISIASTEAFWPDCSGNCALWSVSTRDWWGRCAAHGFDMRMTWEAYCVNLCHCRAKVRRVALPLGKLGVRMVRLVSRVSWPTEMHCTREHKWCWSWWIFPYFHEFVNVSEVFGVVRLPHECQS